MAVKAYVLIEADVGKAGAVMSAVRKLEGVKSADSVTGSFDVIAVIAMADLDAVGSVVKQIHAVGGVSKTTTCIGVKYS